MTYTCDFCSKEFKRESTLESHKCTTRNRAEMLNLPESRIAFQAYTLLYKTPKTQADFIKSPYYKGLLQYGQYCVNTKVIDSEVYTKHLLGNNVPLNKWQSDQEYTKYLIGYLPKESPGPALTRAQKYAKLWSQQAQAPDSGYLRYGNDSTLAQAIITGKLSGWVLYSCSSGQEFLTRLSGNGALLNECWPYIEADTWCQVFKRNPTDYEFAQNTLTELGW